MVRKITKDEHETEGGINPDYYDEEDGEFRTSTVVAVHCEDDDEARRVAKAVSKQVGSSETE
jgi:hypothetical protein